MSFRASATRILIATSVLLVLAMPSASMLHLFPDAEAYSGITISFDHPVFAGKKEVVPCTLTINGGPASEGTGNYSFRLEASGKNTTGWTAAPASGTSSTGTWKINVTMPLLASQTLKIKVNATSRNENTKEVKYLDQSFDIKIVDPIVIAAEIFNNGPVDARNVTAKFFADGTLLHTKIFNLSANSSTTLHFNWTFLKIKDGKHIVTVSVDDAGKVVEFSDGNNVFSRTIFVEPTGNALGGVLTVAVIILSVFVGLMYLQKPIRRKK